MSDSITCDYCKRPAELVAGDVVYPHRPDLRAKKFYRCEPCAAWVGCHPNTTTPMGRLATKDLREAKQAAHAAFDPIWKERFDRKSAEDSTYRQHHARGGRYKVLAKLLGIPMAECHIGMFSVDLCRRTVEICRSGALSE